MAHYRIYYIDDDGSITRGHDAICDTDDDAVDLGHRFLKEWPLIEVWKGTRLLKCLSTTRVLWRPKQPAPAAARTA